MPRLHGILTSPAYIGSPMQEVRNSGSAGALLPDDLPESAHTVLHELKAGGGIDYIAFPMQLGRPGSMPVASFATDRAGGFSEEDVADLHAWST